MKKFFLLNALLLTLFIAYAQKFTIKGNLGSYADDAKVMLTYSNGNEYIQDSAIIKRGKFQFTGNIPEPTRALLELKQKNKEQGATYKRDSKEIFIDAGTVSVKAVDGTMKNAIVQGGKSQMELASLQNQLKPLQMQAEPLSDSVMKYWEKDSVMVDKFSKQTEPLYQQMDKLRQEFIGAHPDSYVSLSLMRDNAAIIEPEKFEPQFNKLSEKLRNSVSGKKMAERLEIARRTAIGRKAIDFEQSDSTGKPVSLASLKGKYVLIDFWASWCGPCRAENPFLVQAYEKFHDRNFEVISISLDSKKDAWLKAIKQDKLNWLHVSDLKGWKNAVAEQYGIRAVPQNYLLDPEGVIIAKNLRAEQLEKKLEEVLTN